MLKLGTRKRKELRAFILKGGVLPPERGELKGGVPLRQGSNKQKSKGDTPKPQDRVGVPLLYFF
jgi:hypothetical protein